MKNSKLKNGMTIVEYLIPQRKSVDVELYIKLNKNEKIGLAHFLEHIHFRRIGNMLQEELYEKLNIMGTALEAKTYKEMLVFYMKVRPTYVVQALDILFDLINTDNWNTEQFENEKKVILKEIVEKEDNTYFQSINDKLLWKNTYLSKSILGEEKNIEDIELNDIINYKHRIFSSNNIAVIIVGNYDVDKVENYIEKFEAVSLNDNLDKKEYKEVNAQFERKPDIKICKFSTWSSIDIRLNFDVDSTKVKENELVFLSAILGCGDGSILQQELREKNGLVYDVYSYAETYERNMILSIEFSTDYQDLLRCLELIIEIIKDFNNIVSQKDIDMNLAFFTDNLWYWEEEAHTLSLELGTEFVRGNKLLTIEERIDNNKKLNISRMKEVSDIIFNNENISLSIMGDTRNIRKKDIIQLFE